MPDSAAHYVNRVLRLAAGDELIVFNQDGAFRATLLSLQGTRGRVQVSERVNTDTESPLNVCLVQGLCRGPRMDYCVQKATELGVHRIVPVITSRCVVRLDDRRAEKKLAHWQAVAVSACEQSGRTSVPVVEPAQRFSSLLEHPPAGLAMLDADQGLPFSKWQMTGNALSLIIGPEGGLTPDEIEALAALGAARWRMGPRVLRTETAGVVALALAQARWGDLDHKPVSAGRS